MSPESTNIWHLTEADTKKIDAILDEIVPEEMPQETRMELASKLTDLIDGWLNNVSQNERKKARLRELKDDKKRGDAE